MDCDLLGFQVVICVVIIFVGALKVSVCVNIPRTLQEFEDNIWK
jgi:hypothetical protein